MAAAAASINPAPAFALKGKTAIVTGAGSGICLSFTTLLLQAGVNVLIADLALRPEAQAVVDKYSTSNGPRAVFVKTDVTKWSELERMIDQCETEFGTFDILCPGAGVYEPTWSNFWHPPGSAASRNARDADHYALLELNLTHPIRATQLALAHWLNPSKGVAKASPANPKRVLHIASIAGYTASIGAPLYHASKFGVVGFVRSLGSLDDEFGVRVNAVAPGLVMTPLWAEQGEKMRHVDAADRSWIGPDDVAKGMVELLTGDWKGGEIMEVTRREGVRRVKRAGDEGPPIEDLAGHKWVEMTAEVFAGARQEGWGMEGAKR